MNLAKSGNLFYNPSMPKKEPSRTDAVMIRLYIGYRMAGREKERRIRKLAKSLNVGVSKFFLNLAREKYPTLGL